MVFLLVERKSQQAAFALKMSTEISAEMLGNYQHSTRPRFEFSTLNVEFQVRKQELDVC
jgi:hypothetical protein